MLLGFAITNFRSIKECQVFSMLPSDRVKTEKRKNTLFQVAGYKDLNVLPLAGIWGRNSAGKSNLVKAFQAIEWLVLHSHKFTRGDSLQANEAFIFDVNCQKNPTLFEIDFIGKDKKRYLYLIEFDKDEILKEELSYYVVSEMEKTNKRKLFIRRKGDSISYGDDFKGFRKTVEERTLPNVLFLSKSVNDNSTFLDPVFDFFKKGFIVSDFSSGYIDFQVRYFAKITGENASNDMEVLNNALRNIDTGILHLTANKSENLPQNIVIEDLSDAELNDEQRQNHKRVMDALKTEIKAVHRLFEGDKEIGIQSISLRQESEGTQKFIAVFSALMQTIKNGNLFVIDEFDKSFHPLLTKMLISLFSNPKININGAQLIITTHDPELMDVLDNDQINLLQKDYTGATEIYTVSDIRGLRGDLSIAKRYLRGELESIPNINVASIHHSLEIEYNEN
jgi:uncharacterized protein